MVLAALVVVGCCAAAAIDPYESWLRWSVDRKALALECRPLMSSLPAGVHSRFVLPSDPAYQSLPTEIRETGARVQISSESVYLELN